MVIGSNFAQSLRGPLGSSNVSFMSLGHPNVEICIYSEYQNSFNNILSEGSTDAVHKVLCKSVKLPGRSLKK